MRSKKKARLEDLDKGRRFLIECMEERGVTAKQLSKMLQHGETYIWSYLWLGSPRILYDWDRRTIAQIMRCEEDRLIEGQLDDVEFEPMADRPLTIPLIRCRLVGETGFINGPANEITRPREVSAKGFAIRVASSRFAPRYSIGDTLFFDPDLPPDEGDMVAVIAENGMVLAGLWLPPDDQNRIALSTLDPAVFEVIDEPVKAVGREVMVIRR